MVRISTLIEVLWITLYLIDILHLLLSEFIDLNVVLPLLLSRLALKLLSITILTLEFGGLAIFLFLYDQLAQLFLLWVDKTRRLYLPLWFFNSLFFHQAIVTVNTGY